MGHRGTQSRAKANKQTKKIPLHHSKETTRGYAYLDFVNNILKMDKEHKQIQPKQ